MEVNEVQGAVGHPLSFPVQGTWAPRGVGKINPKAEREESQENAGEDRREREEPPPCHSPPETASRHLGTSGSRGKPPL